ncbi:porin family protein [Massilia rhizosphaerae]|uniref:porin family protein n=1 Tax=Massilia rhizosphaerae TaxID=2784389 RepID=UPI0018DEBD00|nr:porin family protein [Massilia rhizosphaerae]
MKALTFVLAAAALAAGTAARAQQSSTASGTPDYHPYVGAGVVSANNMLTDSRHADAKIFGGIDFSNNLGIEAGYVNFSRQERQFSEQQTGISGGVTGVTKGYGTYLAAKYTVPINDRFSAYGKLGVSHNERQYKSNVGSNTDIDNGVYAGLGAQYKLNENLSLVGEFEQYGEGKRLGARAGVWSAGLKVGF